MEDAERISTTGSTGDRVARERQNRAATAAQTKVDRVCLAEERVTRMVGGGGVCTPGIAGVSTPIFDTRAPSNLRHTLRTSPHGQTYPCRGIPRRYDLPASKGIPFEVWIVQRDTSRRRASGVMKKAGTPRKKALSTQTEYREEDHGMNWEELCMEKFLDVSHCVGHFLQQTTPRCLRVISPNTEDGYEPEVCMFAVEERLRGAVVLCGGVHEVFEDGEHLAEWLGHRWVQGETSDGGNEGRGDMPDAGSGEVVYNDHIQSKCELDMVNEMLQIFIVGCTSYDPGEYSGVIMVLWGLG
ncbi:hypothetical protein B0H11DRAFT_1913419 [Mycena galericulata]|nr:hypothetical protein B0H11DRAFT_1913419 [Mycena galericulata]